MTPHVPPLPERADVVVVGGGAAGLATAACLRRRGTDALLLDASPTTGHTWAERYDCLHLHTPRWQSALPGLPIPASFGRWVSRDDMVRYLRSYAARYDLRPRHGVRARRLVALDGGWLVLTDAGDVTARQVVVATGLNARPTLPHWPGQSRFRGTVVHASTYRSPGAFAGAVVMVVGAGNSGAEIAADLARGGAERVLLSVRTAPHVIPRSVLGVPTTTLGVAEDHLPAAASDLVNRVVERVAVGRLDGVPRPRQGLVAQWRATGTTPTIDVGVVAALRGQRVTVVPAVADLAPQGVVLVDGRRVPCDAVVAATGFRPGLEDLLDDLPVLGPRGAPVVSGAATHPSAPGLRFVGFRAPLKGVLLQTRLDAAAASRAVARDLGVRTPAAGA